MMHSIHVKGVRFQVVDQGIGPTILLVHGFPLDHSMWVEQIAEFSRDYRVIAPDLRGFGGTDGALYSVSMEQFADDLADLLDALKVEGSVTFCGLSMGGYIGWQFALRHPKRLARLIQCDTRAAADTPDVAANRLKMADIALRDGPEPVAWAMMPKLFAAPTVERRPDLVESVRRVVLASSPVAIAAGYRGMATRPDVTALLRTFRIPTLLVVGEHDAITPATEMKTVAEAIPNAKFAMIREAGHMAPLEKPIEVNAAIRQFLVGS